MKKHLLLLFIILSYSGYSQINISGIVIDSITQKIIPFANIVIEENGSQITGRSSDIDGKFSFEIQNTGTYTLCYEYMMYSKSTQTININSDTNIVIKMVSPLACYQPCRKIRIRHGVQCDLPNDLYQYRDYKRIREEAKVLGFGNILEKKDSIVVRIWSEPAFGYYGGSMRELTNNDDIWDYRLTFYEANYDQLPSHVTNSFRYPGDSLFFDTVKFKITDKNTFFQKQVG